jgi:hypothetical protein
MNIIITKKEQEDEHTLQIAHHIDKHAQAQKKMKKSLKKLHQEN